MTVPVCCVVIGTRPEAIKLAPVIAALRAESRLRTVVVSTAQHRELLDDAVRLFRIEVDEDLDLMQGDQSPAALLGRAITALDGRLAALAPRVVVAEGDTGTALAAALVAFQRGVPFAHVEAGLRTSDLGQPFPEEGNRRLIGRVAALHLAPTARASDNLRAEGVPEDAIVVTGNPVVDALVMVGGRLPPPWFTPAPGRRLVLVTLHRRESLGAPLVRIARTLRELSEREDLEFVLPLHPNPRVQAMLRAELTGSPTVHLTPPLSYVDFLALLRDCWLVLSDSGGVQEEAPSFGKPLLVLRERTERVEGVEAGLAQLVGSDPRRIRDAVLALLASPVLHQRMCARGNPYGDGRAAKRIVEALVTRYGG
ncbi:MAG: UDP-N-acetylglucosamine 2-epimerase (non-hydrolyzing) [Planctomycetota bacterium]